jgi:hypothetical protein
VEETLETADIWENPGRSIIELQFKLTVLEFPKPENPAEFLGEEF